ncbi:DNA-binding response regulator [Bacteroides sp. 224]|nr:DNA-binding response regulator [Bacteroides sp. 224]
MHCIAIDDEPLALKQIIGYISKTPFLELTKACSNAMEAISIIAENDIDILFVDINMPDLNGLDFVRSLNQKPLVIFTTAYSEYAIEGFRVDAIDYLLKPFGYPDFLKSAEKAYRQFKLINTAHSSGNNLSDTKYIFVKSEYRTIQIIIDSITHIESRSEYLRIYSEVDSPVMTLGSLKLIKEKLPSEHFMRIHRSYIINLKKISAIERGQIIINKSTRIPIGEQYKEEFQEYLEKHSFTKK